jgi:UDP-N-acetylglucosamine 3-dehydrogenase
VSETTAKPMRLCLLGCGRAAASHSGTARSFGPRIECSYASRSLDKARRFTATHGGVQAFDGYRQAIESPDIDAVAVLTPPASHLEWTLAALDAGKDVLLEKPPVLHSADFEAIERASARTGRFVLVAENYHYKPVVARIREILASGTIGEPLFIHLNAVKRQQTAGWRDDPAQAGGGALFEGGIHWVNFASSLGFTPRTVKAARPGRIDGLERSMALLIEYAEGPVCVLSYSWEVASPLKGLRISRIYGRKGSIVFESNGLFVATSGEQWRVHFPGVSDIQGYRGMFADFLEAWRERREPRMTVAHARRDLEMIEGAYRDAGISAFKG